ncbi:hypothetical protein LTR28_004510, partial [Elasticomyces elasticus]
IWGGGIWEDDVLYEICDEIGILVWQDFMFACGNYPAYPAIRQSIKTECIAQLRRLRHHPSIVLYAGNNEDYQVQEQFGLKYDYADKNPENWLRTNFPARYIYEKKYQILDRLGGRFVSEFGMEAFPHIDTIKYYVTDPSQLYPQSHMIDFHNKADGHERKIATYLVENFRMQTDLEKFVHLTQLCQSEALMFGYRGWRRRWGQKRFCGGALVWQLNDCWPVTSWAIVDYFLRKKPAFYAIRRVLAPVAVAVKRAHHDWSVTQARAAKTSDYALWVASSKLTELTATVELRYVSIANGKDIKERITHKNIRIVPNGTTEVMEGTIDNTTEEPHVLAARIWVNGELIARDTDWPQPFKYLDFDDRGVEVLRDGDKITVTAKKPTKGLAFEEREGVLLDDSALDVVPGDEQIVTVRGLGPHDRALKWTFLGS